MVLASMIQVSPPAGIFLQAFQSAWQFYFPEVTDGFLGSYRGFRASRIYSGCKFQDLKISYRLFSGVFVYFQVLLCVLVTFGLKSDVLVTLRYSWCFLLKMINDSIDISIHITMKVLIWVLFFD